MQSFDEGEGEEELGFGAAGDMHEGEEFKSFNSTLVQPSCVDRGTVVAIVVVEIEVEVDDEEEEAVVASPNNDCQLMLFSRLMKAFLSNRMSALLDLQLLLLLLVQLLLFGLE